MNIISETSFIGGIAVKEFENLLETQFQESENLIPPQWFFLFENAEKKFFYSHAGDGAIQPDGIYYNTDSASSKKRITDIIDSFSSLNSGEIPKDLDFFLKELQFGLSEILLWIS